MPSPPKKSSRAALALTGFIGAAAVGGVLSPGTVHGISWEHSVPEPYRCKKPAGNCVRFLTPEGPPSQQEIDRYNAQCIDVVWEDEQGTTFYWPASGCGGAMAQDIGL
jgi:hypothetical protein